MDALPQELIDRIIDFLHKDKEDLYNCSLVCHTWLPSTRFHLFSRLFLYSWNQDTLLSLISTPLTTVPNVVSTLNIFSAIDGRLGQHFRTINDELCLATIHTELPDLDFLLGEGFNDFRRLTLEKVVLRSYDDLIPLLMKSRSLTSVSMSGVHFCTVTSSPRGGPEDLERPCLKHLHLRDVEMEDILSWLLSRNCLNHLTTLELEEIVLRNHSPAQIFLRSVGQTLKHLTLGYSLGSGIAIPPFDLSNNTSLETLDFPDVNMSHFDLPHMSPAIPTHMIPTVQSLDASTSIQNISFGIIVDSLAWFDVIDWNVLDESLLAFSSLKKVEFSLLGARLVPPDVVRVVRGRMPHCFAKGHLAIKINLEMVD